MCPVLAVVPVDPNQTLNVCQWVHETHSGKRVGHLRCKSIQLAVREDRSASALSVTARRRVARSFHCLSRRDGSAEKVPLRQLQWTTSLREGCPASHNCSQRFLLQNFGGKRPVAKSWLSLCRLAAKRCPQRDRRNNTSLGQRSHAFAPGVPSRVLHSGSTRRCIKLWRRLPAAPRQSLLRSRRIGGLVLSTDGHNFSNVQARLAAFAHSLLAAALPAQRPRDHRAHKFPRKLARARVWVLASPSRRTADNLRTLRVWRPSPCPGGDARPQRIMESSKQSLRRWSPSHPAPLFDRQTPLEHHV